MEEWSKQRHVDHVALIYFQKMLQVLTPHTSKLPKKVLKNTKNMTPNSCSVRPEKFHPYMKQILHFKNITFKSSYNCFKIDIHQQLQPLTANYLAMFKVISTTIYT